MANTNDNRSTKRKTNPRLPAVRAGTPRRILLTMNALDMSGVSFSARQLAAGLLKHQIKVMTLAREDGERGALFRDMPLTVGIARYFGVPLLGHSALHQVREFAPEYIIAQDTDVLEPTWRLARDLGVPMAVVVNRLDEETYAPVVRRRGVTVIAVSEAIQERLINASGVQRERITIIPNGLDLAEFPQPTFEQSDRTRELPVVGAYGQFAPHKGQRTFLEAAARVLRHGVDAEFLLMGDGPDRAALRKLANDLGIQNRVTFAPPTATDSRNMLNIDLFVEPSHQEGLGLSVLQAMAMGVPVVASGVGGIFALIEDGRTGTLVPKGDSERLAEAIAELLADPSHRIEMARQGRERVENVYSAKAVAKAVLDLAAKDLSDRETGNA